MKSNHDEVGETPSRQTLNVITPLHSTLSNGAILAFGSFHQSSSCRLLFCKIRLQPYLDYCVAILPVHFHCFTKLLFHVVEYIVIASANPVLDFRSRSFQLEPNFPDLGFRGVPRDLIDNGAERLVSKRSFRPSRVGNTRSASLDDELLYLDF